MGKSKKYFCIFLSVMICTSSLVAKAETLPDDEHIMNGWEEKYRTLEWLVGSLGAFVIQDREWAANNQNVTDFMNNMEDGNYYWKGDDGYIHFTDECMDKVKEIADDYIDEQTGGNAALWDFGDYKMVPTLTLDAYTNFMSGMDNALYDHICDLVNSNGVIAFENFAEYGVDRYRWPYVIGFDDLHFVLWSGDFSWFYDFSGEYGKVLIRTFAHQKQNGISFPDASYERYSNNNSNGVTYRFCFGKGYFSASSSRALNIISSDGRYMKVWDSVEALRKYLRGQSSMSVYVSSSYYKYDSTVDNSITINQQTLNKIIQNDISVDISNAQNYVTEQINSYYTENNRYMSDAQLQQLVDEVVEQVLDGFNVPDQPDPGPWGSTENPIESESPGESTSGTVSGNVPGGDGPQTLSWLEKIYNKLVDVLAYLEGGITDALNGIKNAITANTLVDVAGSVIGLLKDLLAGGADAVGSFKDTVTEAFAPAVDMLPEKFPTCIPWDLIAIFTVVAASGAPPVYEVPFSIPGLGIDETVTLDLSIFEPVAVVCRALLSIIFLIGLIHMTIRLTRGGDS